jgi:hypothetical protein
LELQQEQMDRILEPQQELIEMVFWNRSESRWRWYFGTAARTDADGILEPQQELIEMVFWNCIKS